VVAVSEAAVKYIGTGRCFEDAATMAWLVFSCAKHPDAAVVHGLCVFPPGHPDEGETFSHAWLEWDGKVWEYAIRSSDGEKVVDSADSKIFYLAYQVRETTKYSLSQFLRLTVEKGDGPWEELYKRHRNPPAR